jgi:hypothetical protein
MTRATTEPSLLRRLAWLVVLWTGSVLSLALVAWLLRLLMSSAGLTTPN